MHFPFFSTTPLNQLLCYGALEIVLVLLLLLLLLLDGRDAEGLLHI